MTSLSIPLTMRAAYFTSTGGPEVITAGRLPVPGREPGSILVRVLASAVNHVDTFVRSGAYATALRSPQVTGRDVVGMVVKLGDGTGPDCGFTPGDLVWSNSLGFGGRTGTAAEYALVPQDRLYPLPPGVDPVEAAAVLHSGATAYLALRRHGRMRSGETVFIGGAAGGVGGAAVALAVRAGAAVVATAGRADVERCLELGARKVLDYRSPDLAAQLADAVKEISGGRGTDIYVETSGHQNLERAVKLLAPRGRIILMSGITATETVSLGRLYTRDGSILGFAISNAALGELAQAAAAVNKLLADGFQAGEVTTWPFEQARHAHAALESGAVRGKIVLVP